MNKLIHNSNRISQVVANDVLEPAVDSVYQKRQKNSANEASPLALLRSLEVKRDIKYSIKLVK